MHPVLHVQAFEDNYIWLIRGRSDTHVALVDPGDAEPVLQALPGLGLTPCAILCTHHHGDHVGGVETLLHHYPELAVYGPGNENIAGINHPVSDGEKLVLSELGITFHVLSVPGHTRGHVAYYGHGWLFCGDTLFSAGCGRLFEGTAAQMHHSLSKLAALPPETQVYCAHEYTLANLRFAVTVEPGNAAIGAYRTECEELLRAGKPTIPTTIGREIAINPFVRGNQPEVAAAASKQAGIRLENPLDVFAAVRKWKDTFR